MNVALLKYQKEEHEETTTSMYSHIQPGPYYTYFFFFINLHIDGRCIGSIRMLDERKSLKSGIWNEGYYWRWAPEIKHFPCAFLRLFHLTSNEIFHISLSLHFASPHRMSASQLALESPTPHSETPKLLHPHLTQKTGCPEFHI